LTVSGPANEIDVDDLESVAPPPAAAASPKAPQLGNSFHSHASPQQPNPFNTHPGLPLVLQPDNGGVRVYLAVDQQRSNTSVGDFSFRAAPFDSGVTPAASAFMQGANPFLDLPYKPPPTLPFQPPQALPYQPPQVMLHHPHQAPSPSLMLQRDTMSPNPFSQALP
jgi:hypothetical protein